MRRSGLPVAIIGAGFAGLAAGRRLQELGIDFEIFEASDGPGGRVRTDRVAGYLCDRGFQLINLEYPDLKRFYQPTEFHRSSKSIDVVIDDKVYRLGDPRERAGNLFSALNPATGSLGEKLAFLQFLREINRDSKRRDSQRNSAKELVDESFEEAMVALGAGTFYSRVLRPFAQGVFLDRCDSISLEMAKELIRYFLTGRPGLPIGGVGAVSQTLAEGLPISYNARVEELGDGFIRVGRRKRNVERVVIATDAIAAKLLLDDAPAELNLDSSKVGPMTMNSSVTWYHSLDDQDLDETLRIDGLNNGPVTNSIAISKLAPEYAPEGKVLIASTVIGETAEALSESRVRKHLASIWGVATEEWELIAKYSITKSLPHHGPGKPLIRDIDFAGRIFLIGDESAFPSQQGALQSGVRVAERIAAI
jgi:protoporphyrinogen oxidase